MLKKRNITNQANPQKFWGNIRRCLVLPAPCFTADPRKDKKGRARTPPWKPPPPLSTGPQIVLALRELTCAIANVRILRESWHEEILPMPEIQTAFVYLFPTQRIFEVIFENDLTGLKNNITEKLVYFTVYSRRFFFYSLKNLTYNFLRFKK